MEQPDSAVVQTVVLDAGPIIHLDEVDCLHLLTDFRRRLLPETVSREIEYHRSAVFLRDVFFAFKKGGRHIFQNLLPFVEMTGKLAKIWG